MQIFVYAHGEKKGPLTLEEVNRQLQDGAFPADALAWYEGLPSWIPVRTVPGVVIPAGGSLLAPALPPALPPAPGRTDPLAICSLVLGILGLICCGVLLASIGAIVCGHISLSHFKRDPRLEGRGMALAGVILGYVGFVVGLLYLVFVFGISFLQAATEGLK